MTGNAFGFVDGLTRLVFVLVVSGGALFAWIVISDVVRARRDYRAMREMREASLRRQEQRAAAERAYQRRLQELNSRPHKAAIKMDSSERRTS